MSEILSGILESNTIGTLFMCFAFIFYANRIERKWSDRLVSMEIGHRETDAFQRSSMARLSRQLSEIRTEMLKIDPRVDFQEKIPISEDTQASPTRAGLLMEGE